MPKKKNIGHGGLSQKPTLRELVYGEHARWIRAEAIRTKKLW